MTGNIVAEKAQRNAVKDKANEAATIDIEFDASTRSCTSNKTAPQPIRSTTSLRRAITRRRSTDDGRYDNIKSPRLEDRPRGYPRLAAYIDSDYNTRLYRRFGYARNRVLLYTQDEIACLEQDLVELDERDHAEQPYILNSRRWDEARPIDSKRRKLITELKAKLQEYDELLLREKKLLQVERPSSRNYKSYLNYIWNEKPLSRDEYDYVFHKDDMISLGVDSGNGWLGPVVAIITTILPECAMKWLFTSSDTKDKSSADHLEYFSNNRLIAVAKSMVLFSSLALLLLPVALLYLLNISQLIKFVIILVSVFIFCIILLSMTIAKHHEVLAAVAAYCAVLVVFLGNTTT